MSEPIVRVIESRGSHRVVMSNGANALDLPLIEELRSAVGRLREGGAPPLALLSADGRLFSPGWDLKRLAHATRDEVERVLERFNDLILEVFSYPGPTLAAIAGHAIAGGCLLAASCDVVVMMSGRPRIGLSEVNLGVPVPAQCTRMLRARMSPQVAEELAFACDGLTAERALELGLVSTVAAADRMDSVVEQELATLAAKPRQAYMATKRFLYEEAWEQMMGQPAEDAAAFLDCWFSPETQERIHTLARSLGR
jgi:enoyl-CoA hydratase/carnithine racemase